MMVRGGGGTRGGGARCERGIEREVALETEIESCLCCAVLDREGGGMEREVVWWCGLERM